MSADDEVKDFFASAKAAGAVSEMADGLTVMRILISRGLTTYDEWKRVKAEAMPVAQSALDAMMAMLDGKALDVDGVEHAVRSFVER